VESLTTAWTHWPPGDAAAAAGYQQIAPPGSRMFVLAVD
jgi:hypothetical protein